MNDERLDAIQQCNLIFPEHRSLLIIELISEIRMLRKLVEAVDTDYGGYACCKDVDGRNWFDVRGDVIG